MGLVAIFTAVDAAKREKLERIDHPSALGDQAHFTREAEFPLRAKVVDWEGEPLYRAQKALSNRDDWRMEPVGREDSGQWMLYRLSRTKSPAEPGTLFLKVDSESYMALRPSAG